MEWSSAGGGEEFWRGSGNIETEDDHGLEKFLMQAMIWSILLLKVVVN
ncbi:hypothetical protein AAULR_02989 [Lacticaseibacillus rhamnosus MTCC 5462]|nr:hypothetical protein AAULR_02989 [Lacticaseibacillus rhamnosus MTCC 5462]